MINSTGEISLSLINPDKALMFAKVISLSIIMLSYLNLFNYILVYIRQK